MVSSSDFFDRHAQECEKNCYPEPVRARLRDLIPEFGVTAGECVLDIGTGPGVLIPYLRQKVGPAGRVCAFDLSSNMARHAHHKSCCALDPVVQADTLAIPSGNAAFHRVICFAAFPHFNNPGRALGEMFRVMRTGGRVIIAHLMSRRELARHHASHPSVVSHTLPDHRRMRLLFRQAGLESPEIVDRPGRYLAASLKPL